MVSAQTDPIQLGLDGESEWRRLAWEDRGAAARAGQAAPSGLSAKMPVGNKQREGQLAMMAPSPFQPTPESSDLIRRSRNSCVASNISCAVSTYSGPASR